MTGIPAEFERAFKADVRKVIMRPDALNIDDIACRTLLAGLGPDAIFTLTVQGCDDLVPDQHVQHPVVRVHVVDLTTGERWKKSDPTRPALYAAETATDRPSPFIPEVMTEPYVLPGSGTSACFWNEDLLYNEHVEHVLKPQTLLLFEVLEFGPRVDTAKFPDGLRPLAWGFLKLLSTKGRPNFGSARLQLYHHTPERPVISRSNTPAIYFEYLYQRNCGRTPYPASLYVHLRAHAPLASRTVRGIRPAHALQVEHGATEFQDLVLLSYNNIYYC
jgi:hypothetical protein